MPTASAMKIATAAAVALFVGFATDVSAASRFRMHSVDFTQGPRPVIHDNGVPDGRVCKISFERVFDPWTEDFFVRKVKRCI